MQPEDVNDALKDLAAAAEDAAANAAASEYEYEDEDLDNDDDAWDDQEEEFEQQEEDDDWEDEDEEWEDEEYPEDFDEEQQENAAFEQEIDHLLNHNKIIDAAKRLLDRHVSLAEYDLKTAYAVHQESSGLRQLVYSNRASQSINAILAMAGAWRALADVYEDAARTTLAPYLGGESGTEGQVQDRPDEDR